MSIFKRNADDPQASYYAKFKFRGRQIYRSLNTTDRRTAEARERNLRRLAAAEKWGEVDGLKTKRAAVHTFGDLWAAYDGAAVAIAQRSRVRNYAALKTLFGADDKTELAVLADCGQVESRYMKDCPEGAAGQSRRRTYNSLLRKAKSVFARRYSPAYRDLSVNFTQLLQLTPVRATVDPWVAPEQTVIAEVERKIAELEALQDARCMAILLAGCAGLRSKEIVHARRQWLGSTGIRIAPDRGFSVKGFASRVVPLSPALRARILALAPTPWTEPDGTLMDYLIAGKSQTARERVVQRQTPQLLRECGLKDQKPFHALRKLYGSIVASTQSLYAAQRALGHSSPTVTSQHYADIVTPIAPVDRLSVSAASTPG